MRKGTGEYVYKQKNSWIAKVWNNGIRIYLGSHKTEQQAKAAVKTYRETLYNKLETIN